MNQQDPSARADRFIDFFGETASQNTFGEAFLERGDCTRALIARVQEPDHRDVRRRLCTSGARQQFGENSPLSAANLLV